MTAIVGAELPGLGVIIGADSASTFDSYSVIRTEGKIVKLQSQLIFATAGHCALGQLAEDVWAAVIRPVDLTHALVALNHRKLIREMVDSLRVAARDAGLISRSPDGCEHFDGTGFLVGIGDQLWNINSWQSIYRRTSGLDAIGCGGPVALGALVARRTLAVVRADQEALTADIIEALKIAADYCAGVKGPFNLLSTIA